MNHGETLAEWHLRLNGFFVPRDFVLHRPTLPNLGQASDRDLVALRPPYVYEEIGGKEEDWDAKLKEWGLVATGKMIGVVSQVKTSPSAFAGQAFERDRLLAVIGGMGLVPGDAVENVVERLLEQPAYAVDERTLIAKLLVGGRPTTPNCYYHMPLDAIDSFIRERLSRYRNTKQADRLRFHDEGFSIWRGKRASAESHG